MSPRPEPLRAALAQINSTVGDLTGNAERIAAAIDHARAEQAQLVVLPELALTGYPPEDLLLKTHFLDATADALGELAAHTRDIVAVVGFAESDGDTYNAAAVLAEGRVAGVYRKLHLPNYGVFDEQRYFQAGSAPATIEVNGVSLGLTICEDIWMPGPPASSEALAGARVIVNLSASPVSRPQGHGAGANARPARPRLPIGRAVLQPRRRPGRADLRRPQPGPGSGGTRDRAGAAVRGVADGVHHRPGSGHRRPAARQPPPQPTCAARAAPAS